MSVPATTGSETPEVKTFVDAFSAYENPLAGTEVPSTCTNAFGLPPEQLMLTAPRAKT